jgi:signal transduction histidine kinase
LRGWPLRGHIKIGCVEQGDCWKLSVADNGPGIEAKYFDKIFKIFQTLAPRDGAESMGIGLSIVKKLVELNNGRVWVESEVGEGSTFFFTLPKQEQGTTSANTCPPKTGECIRQLTGQTARAPY